MANGCETSLTSLTNCGSCGTPCTRANATATCASGSCLISSCNANFANTDGIDANGCECAMEIPDAAGVCGSAYSLGTLTDPTGTATLTGRITSVGDIDCFSFNGADSADTDCDTYHVDIRFTSNPSNQFQFNVYRANCSTLACASTLDSYAWYTDYTTGSMGSKVGECGCRTTNTYDYNLCNDSTANYYFCVSRVSGAPTCDAYSISVTNGFY
jgi:hypothetical protein